MFSGSNKIIFIILILALLGFAGYYFYNNQEGSSLGSLLTTETNQPNIGPEIRRALNRANRIDLSAQNINKKIFTNPSFSALIDHSVIVPEELPGRINPDHPFRPFEIYTPPLDSEIDDLADELEDED